MATPVMSPLKRGLTHLFLVLAVTSTVFAAQAERAQGTNSSGGGGVYRRDGSLKTLAEVGAVFDRAYRLAPKSYRRYYKISDATKEELRKILAVLPPGDLIAGEQTDYPSSYDILSLRNTFIDQREIDKAEYEKIKADYRKVIASYGKKLDESAFVLVAYGKDNQTFILPAFDELTPFRQALTLIHEYFMRKGFDDIEKFHLSLCQKNKNEPCIQSPEVQRLFLVLGLDAMILKIVKEGYNDESTFQTYRQLERLGGIDPLRVRYFALELLMKRLNRPLMLSEITLEGRMAPLDPSLLMDFEKLVPGIAETFDGWSLSRSPSKVASSLWDHYMPDRDKLGEANFEKMSNMRGQTAARFEEICSRYRNEGKAPTADLIAFGADGLLYTVNCSRPSYVLRDLAFIVRRLSGAWN